MGGSGSHCEEEILALSEEQMMMRELSQNRAYYEAKEAIIIGKKGAYAHMEYVSRCEDAWRKKKKREKQMTDQSVAVPRNQM